MKPFPTLTHAEHARLIEAWRATGATAEAQVEHAAHWLVDLALQIASPTEDAPVVILAGKGFKGAVGMAAARLLHGWNIPLRVVLAAKESALSLPAAAEYERIKALALPVWSLSMPQAHMDSVAPIHWLSVAILLDTMLDADLDEEPDDESADLIRMANSTRRPIVSFDVPSGVSGDEGYIMSPCIKATHTLALGLPRRGAIEAAPVSGTIWLAPINIPDLIWASLRLPERPAVSTSLTNLGPARGLR